MIFSMHLQGFQDENETHDVPAISGSCILIRREVINQNGALDERLFVYQEDTYFCVSARKAGWKVTYYPESKVIHFGVRGGGGAQPFRQIFVWHQSYFRYYRKQLAGECYFPDQLGLLLNDGIEIGVLVMCQSLQKKQTRRAQTGISTDAIRGIGSPQFPQLNKVHARNLRGAGFARAKLFYTKLFFDKFKFI